MKFLQKKNLDQIEIFGLYPDTRIRKFNIMYIFMDCSISDCKI